MWTLFLLPSATAATLEVCSSCTYTTLRDAVDSADPGDLIDVLGGTHSLNATVGGDLTIRGTGPGTVLTCDTQDLSMLEATDGARLALVDVGINGCSAASTLLTTNGELYLESISFTNQSSTVGDGSLVHIATSSASAWVVDATVDEIDVTGIAGLFSVKDGSLVLQGGNYGKLRGPAVARLARVDGGTLSVLDVKMQASPLDNYGMVYLENGANLAMERSTFQNVKTRFGALIQSDGGNTLSIRHSIFQDHDRSGGGGAVLATSEGDVVTLVNNRFIGNTSNGDGGAASIQRPARLVSRRNLWCANSNNTNQFGGALTLGLSDDNLEFDLHHDVFLHNQSYGGAGIRLFAAEGNPTVAPGISSTTFASNSATISGLGHQVMNSGVTYDIRSTGMHQASGGRHLLNNSGGTSNLYDSAYATPSTAIHSNGVIKSGSTAPVTDLGFFDLPGANCENALATLGAAPNGVLHTNNIGALLPEDLDGDGYLSKDDCDDDDPTIHPNRSELCDDVDHDCNGDARTSNTGTTSDLDVAWRDVDGDGYGDDEHPDTRSVCPGDFLPSGWVRKLDTNGKIDCDDTNAERSPDAEERCDDGGLDTNCDGDPDAGAADLQSFYADVDNDDFGDVNAVVKACDAPGNTGWTLDGTDCDDTDDERFPGNDERCDDIDHDCDNDLVFGAIDASTWYVDDDGDSWGASGESDMVACTAPSGFVGQEGDCEDDDNTTYPGADERCDDIDHDCDGEPTAGAVDTELFYPDLDGDLHGDLTHAGVGYCEAPSESWVASSDDCDDASAERFPGNPERCDSIDHDCDNNATAGAIDTIDYVPDADQDGHGSDSATPTAACEPPDSTWVTSRDDCNDSNADQFPGNEELCDALDRDCDGDPIAGATDLTLAFLDADADGHGDPTTGEASCEPDEGTSLLGDDCDDSNADISPSAEETCNSIDDDCDDDIDEGCDDTGDTGDTGDTAETLVDKSAYTTLSGGCSTAPTGGSWGMLLLMGFCCRRRLR